VKSRTSTPAEYLGAGRQTWSEDLEILAETQVVEMQAKLSETLHANLTGKHHLPLSLSRHHETGKSWIEVFDNSHP
jgi:hypothetical protein